MESDTLITGSDFKRLLEALQAFERYSLISIEKNSRTDLPWTVTLEGKGHTCCYYTFGTFPEVKAKASRMIKTLNSKRNWGGKLEATQDLPNID